MGDVSTADHQFPGFSRRQNLAILTHGENLGAIEGAAHRARSFVAFLRKENGDPLALRQPVHGKDVQPGKHRFQLLDIGEGEPLPGIGDGSQPRQFHGSALVQRDQPGVDGGNAGKDGDLRFGKDPGKAGADLVGIADV